MDKVLDKLADIENTASGIMEEANKRKSQFAQEMDEKTRAFDQELEKETQNRIRQVQETMERDMNQKLKEQKERSDRLLWRWKQIIRNIGRNMWRSCFRK